MAWMPFIGRKQTSLQEVLFSFKYAHRGTLHRLSSLFFFFLDMATIETLVALTSHRYS